MATSTIGKAAQVTALAHPGSVVREYLERLGLSITDASERLGISRKSLSELLNAHAGISADMALRLERALGTTAEMWLMLQLQYDLAKVREKLGRGD